jgi:hypothetical protein
MTSQLGTGKPLTFSYSAWSFHISIMDEGTTKTQNPKCRLYWCLKEFIDWRYSQACWYFRPL